MKEFDDRCFDGCEPTDALIHRIRHKMRECREHNIDIEPYVNKGDLYIMLEVLDCCLRHKDGRSIERLD